ncbi:hypothetical protein LshimejAT787_0309970 [Lyophyllum shimeji]|uniref:Uncharacterized protein n=1 Tax=Lyophyllum shimeji TaxID=47721 RepID=A0A9P3PIR7_LYOSH|nr:hypothetical protein LshimejAT787_0309970 [Lyophyllum shimeji]
MSAQARAEARRKAILSRGSDRLAKLTTSARGSDPAYFHDDPPLPRVTSGTKAFVGEESIMPPPPDLPSPSPSPRPSRTTPPTAPTSSSTGAGFGPGVTPDPAVWSEQQQQQFMQALMAANSLSRSPESLPGLTPTDVDPTLPPLDNPLAAMLFPQGDNAFPPGAGAGAAGKAPAAAAAAVDPPPPTRLQKLMPFVHLISMWCLLAYFVLYKEPQAYLEAGGSVEATHGAGLWRRWAELGRSSPVVADGARFLKVQVVPFFWAFTTLQIVLHSVRIFSGFDAVQPPTLLALALPHLPPPLPSVIVNGLKYLQMGSLFLDDLSGLIVGLGFIVLFSGWLAS